LPALLVGLLCSFAGGASIFADDPPARPLNRIVVERGQMIRMQMTTKRPIVAVELDKEGIISVEPAPNDLTTVYVTGLAPGIVRMTLRDDRGAVEKRQMGMAR
jgi:hypothetical protein